MLTRVSNNKPVLNADLQANCGLQSMQRKSDKVQQKKELSLTCFPISHLSEPLRLTTACHDSIISYLVSFVQMLTSAKAD